MRVLARIGCTLAGLALLAPAGARAGLPTSAKAKAKAPKKLCAVCQYRAMTARGVRVPTPPPLPPGTPVRGEECAECGQPTAVAAGGRVYRSGMTAAEVMARTAPSGRAVIGDEPPGLASTGGAPGSADPVPIGAVGPALAGAGYGAGAGAGGVPSAASVAPGSRDAAVMPTSMASDPIRPPGSNRPHVISHVLGISTITRDWRDWTGSRQRRKEENHASISYGPQPSGPLTEVPASVVYGRR